MSNDILKKIDLIDSQLEELRTAVKEEQKKVSSGPARDLNDVPIMLTLQQASQKTGLSQDYLRKLCLQNKIIFVRAGSKYLINFSKLIDYLNAGEAIT